LQTSATFFVSDECYISIALFFILVWTYLYING